MVDLFGSLESLLLSFGYVLLFGFVFAESGLFFGFFLPGDSLLFTAGIFAQKGIFDIAIILPGVIICAILGDQVGYWMGSKFGRRFFSKPGDWFRDPEHITSAEEFYKKHGKKTIVLARFVPAVRTFAPIVAGIAKMEYGSFLVYNVLGGILWSVIFIGGGYLIGSILPNAGETITLVVIAIVVISTIPVCIELLKRKNKGVPHRHRAL